MTELPDYVLRNREHWDSQAAEWVAGGERAWVEAAAWGIWQLPEDQVRMLPDDMAGMDAIELGCGTGYVSAWMIRRGAQVVGIDNSVRQLETAQRLADEHGVALELIHGNAETVPYPDESFDFAISEYGAAIWADPYVWIPEAWRLLRPGGRLVFLGHHPMRVIVEELEGPAMATRKLLHPYFGLHRFDWHEDGDEGTEFNLPISEWTRLFAQVGFDLEEYLELRAPATDADPQFGVPVAWARDYPSEQVWKLRKPA